MKASKKELLEKQGWTVGDTDAFLGLSKEESAYIALKINLGESLKARRKQNKLTQTALAKIIHSNQARVARMEKGDPSVSIDLLIKSLYSLGTTNNDLAEIISKAALIK